jgi:aspartokinase/homoserine dehydrogenase 1
VLAAVGDRMAHTPGVAATFFSRSAKAGVSVRAIAQGSSERNISAVIDRADSTRALRAVHAGFVLSIACSPWARRAPASWASALLAQLAEQAPVLRERFRASTCACARSPTASRMLLSETLIDLSPERELLARDGEPTARPRGASEAHVRAPHLPHAVIADCTASESVAAQYAGWLAAGPARRDAQQARRARGRSRATGCSRG